MPNQKPIPKDACYFLTLNVVDRIGVFTRPAYKQIIVDALNHFIDQQGLIIYAWCLMNSHLHLLIRTRDGHQPAIFEREFKKFTTPTIWNAIETEGDQRKEWMLQRFEEFSKSLKKIEKFLVWQSCNSPLYIDCTSPSLLLDRIDHIHGNPVRDGIVDQPESYLCSSARDYAGIKGLVKVTVIRPTPGVPRFSKLSSN